jgi:hypothetical protein
MRPLVVEVDRGAALLWVEAGKLWRADRLCRGAGYTPWVQVFDAPGVGGEVLSDADVARLVAPHESATARASVRLSRTPYEREEEAKARHQDEQLERRRMGADQ